MGDVLTFQGRPVKPDHLPEPGNRYQAFAFWETIKPPMLFFVKNAGRSMRAFNFNQMGAGEFYIRNDEGDRDGEAAMHVTFGGLEPYKIVITGYNIFGMFINLCDVRWIWEHPDGQAAARDGQPLVYSIEFLPQTLPRS